VVKRHDRPTAISIAMIVTGGIVKGGRRSRRPCKIVIKAGFVVGEPGLCRCCLAMNPDQLAPEERCARHQPHFEGRQGFKGRTIWCRRPLRRHSGHRAFRRHPGGGGRAIFRRSRDASGWIPGWAKEGIRLLSQSDLRLRTRCQRCDNKRCYRCGGVESLARNCRKVPCLRRPRNS